jgi:hypothetical protein
MKLTYRVVIGMRVVGCFASLILANEAARQLAGAFVLAGLS